jgi:hypothetical protein
MTTMLCDVCGKIATNTCKLCGKRVCDAHYDSKLGLCTACKAGRRLKK